MYSPYYLRNNSNNPCTSPIIPPNNAPKYVIIFNSFFVIDRTKSSNLSVENVDTSCWTISARCRLFSILSTFSVPHFKPFVTALGRLIIQCAQLSLVYFSHDFLSKTVHEKYVRYNQSALTLAQC